MRFVEETGGFSGDQDASWQYLPLPSSLHQMRGADPSMHDRRLKV
jgi:hypothetical protein